MVLNESLLNTPEIFHWPNHSTSLNISIFVIVAVHLKCIIQLRVPRTVLFSTYYEFQEVFYHIRNVLTK